MSPHGRLERPHRAAVSDTGLSGFPKGFRIARDPADRANLIALVAIERRRTTRTQSSPRAARHFLRKTVPTTTIASATPCRAVPLPGLALVALATSQPPTSAQSDTGLATPRQFVVDSSLSRTQVDPQILVACLYDRFWSTGGAALIEAALASDLPDWTLPPGRSPVRS
jgi:hypothetical protein